MFNQKKEVATVETTVEQVVTIIGPGATIDGPLTTKDSTRIDGTVNGNTTISGSLIVGQGGKINGTVTAQNVFIAGEINGNISTVNGKVEISDTGKITGDITCKTIVIDENAVFQGKCTMNADKSSAETAKERAAGN
ncbi:MAG: polymer-forming cytoskeletal protein [Butyrivibrio sp.]|jgi:cytoskeletal protein CcmA (bactofilin family)|nr:polymer-forming cytoskeletal protein [Butyrivibrio sp.]